MDTFQGLPGRLVVAPARGHCVLCGRPFAPSETIHEQATGAEHIACAVQAQRLLASFPGAPLSYTALLPSPLGEPHRVSASEDEQLAGLVVVPLVTRRIYCWKVALRLGLVPGRAWPRIVQARPATIDEVHALERRERTIACHPRASASTGHERNY